MKALTPQRRSTALAVAACAVLVCGCTTLRSPFDPTGERIFAQPSLVPPPATGSFAPSGSPPSQVIVPPGATIPPSADLTLPGAIAAPAPAAPGAVVPGPMAPGGAMPLAPPPGTVAPSPLAPAAGLPAPGAAPAGGPELVLVPQESVAPIGTHVVLLAGTRDRDNYLRTNQRIDWTLVPGSVGQFVEVGTKGFTDWLMGDFTVPQIVNPAYAITSTSRQYLRHTRGTPNPEDDITVLAGQAWITTTSLVEGTMWVSAHAPAGYGWQTRTAAIHWIDGQWCFPPPAITAAGVPHVFTTTVMRQSNQAPHVGWLVRYEITGGPPAGFSPDGGPVIEVAVDEQGRASAEIIQPQPLAGTNQISIQVIRPASPECPERRLVVGTGSTLKTWADTDMPIPQGLPSEPAPQPTALPQIEVQTTGPGQAKVGDDVTFRILVTNVGQAPATGLQVRDKYDEGLQHAEAPSPIIKDLGTLAPGQSIAVGVVLRVMQPGRWCHNVEILAGDRVLAQGQACVTTEETGPPQVPPPTTGQQPPAAPSIDLQLTGPESRVVGELAVFDIRIANNGERPATNLQVFVEYDPVFAPSRASPNHEVIEGRLVWSIPARVVTEPRRAMTEIAPRDSVQFAFECRCPTATPRACIRATVQAGQQVLAQQEKCLEIRSSEPPAPPPSNLSLTIDATREPVTAGQELSYLIRVTNAGQAVENSVVVAVGLPPQLTLVRLQTVGPTGIGYDVQGSVIRFAPVPQLAPGMRLDYRVRAKAVAAGQVAVQAEVASQASTQPVVNQETTTILPQ